MPDPTPTPEQLRAMGLEQAAEVVRFQPSNPNCGVPYMMADGAVREFWAAIAARDREVERLTRITSICSGPCHGPNREQYIARVTESLGALERAESAEAALAAQTQARQEAEAERDSANAVLTLLATQLTKEQVGPIGPDMSRESFDLHVRTLIGNAVMMASSASRTQDGGGE